MPKYESASTSKDTLSHTTSTITPAHIASLTGSSLASNAQALVIITKLHGPIIDYRELGDLADFARKSGCPTSVEAVLDVCIAIASAGGWLKWSDLLASSHLPYFNRAYRFEAFMYENYPKDRLTY